MFERINVCDIKCLYAMCILNKINSTVLSRVSLLLCVYLYPRLMARRASISWFKGGRSSFCSESSWTGLQQSPENLTACCAFFIGWYIQRGRMHDVRRILLTTYTQNIKFFFLLCLCNLYILENNQCYPLRPCFCKYARFVFHGHKIFCIVFLFNIYYYKYVVKNSMTDCIWQDKGPFIAI